MKPRLLHLTTCLEPGGAEQMILSLARGMADDFDLTVAFLKGGGALASEFTALGARVVPLGITGAGDLRGLRRLWRLIRQSRFDLVHTHLFHAGLLGRALGRLSGVPAIVHTQHNTLTWETSSPVLAAANRASLRAAHRVIAVGERVAEMLRLHGGVKPECVTVIRNGVDCERFRPGGGRAYARSVLGDQIEGPIIGAVAGFRPEKGHDVLIAAMRFLRDAAPAAKLLLLGDGPLRPAVEQSVARQGLSDRVLFGGRRADVDRILPACDLVVLPSWQEGVPVSALEAMACGLPVVATSVGGTPEVVVDGRTGVLVAPGDARALAFAVLDLLRRPEWARRLGKEGRDCVKSRFDAGEMIRRTVALYGELLDGRGGGANVRN
ncbi:MAG: glycosyltransferase [Deltaproteobacteria bacterium]|nr:glycosyltransferase [Deltaproteobacteria bacterium]